MCLRNCFECDATNGHFAHQKNVLIAMVGDDYENVGNVGVAKALARRKQVAEESAHNYDCPPALNNSLIRWFDVPTLNLEANAYCDLANFDSYQQQPQAIASLTDTEIEKCLKKPLALHYLSRCQSVERPIKRVAEASAYRRERVIQQKN